MPMPRVKAIFALPHAVTGQKEGDSMKRTRILTQREIRQLVRVHRQIGSLLASNGVTPTPRRAPPKAKPRPPGGRRGVKKPAARAIAPEGKKRGR